jgi:tetratricopeptide (TPR) repeat protein
MKRWGRSLAFLLSVAMAGTAPARAAPETAAILTEISNALAAGNGAGALQLAETALAAPDLPRPEQAQLLVDRGLAHEMRGERPDALADFTSGIEMHALAPQAQARALFARGVTLDELGRTQDALGDYSAAIRLVPGYASALNNRANVYRRGGQVGPARRDYLAALAAVNLHPEFSYFGLGQLAEGAGDQSGARDFYAKAVAANPAYGEARDRLSALGTAVDAPITLRPPPGAASVVLRPPQAVRLHMPVPRPPAAPAKPVAAGRPVLRPALDSPLPAGPQLQLGAWRSQAEADAGWARALAKAPALLEGLAHQVVPVDLPGRGRYYRLRVRAQAGGAAVCARLEALGVECMAVRD